LATGLAHLSIYVPQRRASAWLAQFRDPVRAALGSIRLEPARPARFRSHSVAGADGRKSQQTAPLWRVWPRAAGLLEAEEIGAALSPLTDMVAVKSVDAL
jgi:hypothetical protein